MPAIVTFPPPFALYSLSKNGNAYWHTGHEILKNTATTGPIVSASCSENLLPPNESSSKLGAFAPAESVVTFCPPNMRLSKVIAGLAFFLNTESHRTDPVTGLGGTASSRAVIRLHSRYGAASAAPF